MVRVPRLSTTIALRWARGSARRRPPRRFEKLPGDTRARILVVNTTGIGDTIFCTAPIADLRESFPHARIDIFVDRRRVELVENNPRIDEVVVYPGKFKRMRGTIRKLRRAQYDLAIIQHANDPDVVPIVAAGRPAYLVGYESHTFSMLYSVALPPADRAGGDHTIDARLELSKVCGGNGKHWHTELYPDQGDIGQAQEALEEIGIEPGTAIAVNVGGSLPSKRWPVERWAELANRLSEQGLPVLFVGGPTDALLAELVRDRLKGELQRRFLVGKLSLMATAALLRLCRAHVTPDTGLMQAGLALDVPTIAMFGPDDPDWTGPHPRQQNAVVVRSDPAAKPEGYNRREDRQGILMRTIDVDTVLKETLELLGMKAEG